MSKYLNSLINLGKIFNQQPWWLKTTLSVFLLSLSAWSGWQLSRQDFWQPAPDISVSRTRDLNALPSSLDELDLPPAELPETPPALKPLPTYTQELKLANRQLVHQALEKAGVNKLDAQNVINSLKPWLDFKTLKAGQRLNLTFTATDNRLQSLELTASPALKVKTTRTDENWQGEKLTTAVTSKLSRLEGTISNSLWEALTNLGEKPPLIVELADIFAWEIDFYSELQPQDTFRLLVEKYYVDGEFAYYGPIKAAEFSISGKKHQAFLYYNEQGKPQGYYNEEGRSQERYLLKSPLKYGHITSRFGLRRHPILGFTRRHNGIDYGVPIGTPVLAVGSGRVVKAGYTPGFGKIVEIQHQNGWRSQYAHLSKILVHKGEHVPQKRVIGRVGQTGLATGPHLHYGLLYGGNYVNPLKQKFKNAKNLQGADLQAFKNLLPLLKEQLEPVVAINKLPPASNTLRLLKAHARHI